MASTNEIWLCDFGEPYPRERASLRPALIIGPPETFGPVFALFSANYFDPSIGSGWSNASAPSS